MCAYHVLLRVGEKGEETQFYYDFLFKICFPCPSNVLYMPIFIISLHIAYSSSLVYSCLFLFPNNIMAHSSILFTLLFRFLCTTYFFTYKSSSHYLRQVECWTRSLKTLSVSAHNPQPSDT